MAEHGTGPRGGARFARRVALVTGASRGIGLACARRLVDEGARVVVTARRPEPLTEAVAALGGPDHALAVAGRADDAEHRAAAMTAALERFGRLDVLVNNAGINPVLGPLLTMDVAAARKTVEVNVLAAIAWTRLAVETWMGEHGGAIVGITSVAGLRPAPGVGFYGATKAMLAHVTAELAVELAPTVRVNAVAPAVVRTRFSAALFEDREEQAIARYPLRRLGEPEDVAAAVAYLASDDASWVTGQVLVVDGGLTLGGGL